MEYQVAVLGGGPGGYVAGIRAAQLGMKVCVIEKGKLGGTCLNVGCIPTKALLASAEIYHTLVLSGSHHGIVLDNMALDMAAMVRRKDTVVKQLAGGIGYLFKKNGVTLIKGKGNLLSSKEIKVKTQEGIQYITADNIIIATGSVPLLPEAFGYDGEIVCSSDEALSWQQLPEKLVIIGGGVIGCEFATLYSSLGCDVTVVELLPSLLSNLDEDLAKAATSSLQKRGVNIYTGVSVQTIEKQLSGAVVNLSNGEALKADRVLVAIGRKPVVENIGLEYLGLNMDKGRIAVNGRMETGLSNVYAIGDVCNSPFDLAHTASREGIVAVENIAGKDSTMDYSAIPNCVFTQPELATVGLTAKEVKQRDINVKISVFKFSALGKALAMGQPEGFIKLVVDASNDRLIGAQMAGPHVTDIIAQTAVLVRNKGTVDQLIATVHAHPTLAEGVWEAAEGIYGRTIHS
ncbi:MAG TPA: dihydrolipoyl dehydrogenase [Clostridiales bacterium]|nr:dihydrolipoyl dehydrogenase [Clostridiales bacterium]